MINALTIDIEDYFQTTSFDAYVKRNDWDNYQLRVADNTLRILDLLDEFSVKATFFTLGWVAEKKPALIKEIQGRGHEIACHGYEHKLIYMLKPEAFREDTRRAKTVLEDICGKRIDGYRAASFSIIKKSVWALDVLAEEGFAYDSSIYPVTHDIYGMKDYPRFPLQIKKDFKVITEFPLTTLEIKMFGIKYRLPASGGGYLRLFPARLFKYVINHVNEREKKPAVIYFHPWEFDPAQPRIKADFKSRFRHYVNIETTNRKIRYLLSIFKFAPMKDVLNNIGLLAPNP